MANVQLYNTEVDSLSWFHPTVTRHQAESMLIQNGVEGSYLLRQATHDQRFTLSVKFVDSVRHFPIEWNGQQYKFGLATFDSFPEFRDHFENRPILKGTGDAVVCLAHPYPNDVSEPALYDRIVHQAELGKHRSTREPPKLSLATKAGYLVKLGGFVKNWKRRWFVADHQYLAYYKTKDSPEPIRKMNLEECAECTEDTTQGQDFCFRLVFPWRTFYLCATSQDDMKQWIDLLSWKVDKIQFEQPVYSP